jgi:LysM repeat protein
MKLYSFFLCLALLSAGCSPIKTSLHDDRYQWELTIHEVQTNVDDLRHDTNCFNSEIQILDGRLKSIENAFTLLKQHEIEKQQAKLEQISNSLGVLDRKWTAFEKKQDLNKDGMELLSGHAKETSLALVQFKSRIEELESEIASQNRKLEAVVRLKNSLETLTKSLKPKIYKVKPGDSLEKIARVYQTDVVTLKKINELHNDLIVVDQELSLP